MFDGTNFEQQDEVLDVLMRAREHVARPGGWCRGAAEVAEAKCASHWIYALSEADIAAKAHAVLWQALPAEWSPSKSTIRCVIAYNDYPGRTQDEVVALYDAAITLRGSELQTGGTRV